MTLTLEQKQEQPTCNYCGKQLHGREGKKYCNVDCKNNFNSRIRSELRSKENEFFPKAFNQIKVNYRILHNYKEELEDGNGLYMELKELVKFGFDPDFCTNAYIDYRERLWKSCKNYYWHDYGDTILIKYMQGRFNRNQ
jgi:hypothetical protein